MTKACSCLGEFVPYGKELLADGTGGTHYLVASERDGLVSEEELYAASDGRVAWSSGNHIIQGFQAATKAEHLFVCNFSALTPESGGSSASSSNFDGSSAVEGARCLGILQSDSLTVYAPSGAEFLVHAPSRAVHAWPLADGVLLLMVSPQGTYHAVSLVGHPLNLPRCVSYIEPPATANGTATIWKDVPPTGGRVPSNGAQIRWVCNELPLAVAYLPLTRRHAVLLLRRRVRPSMGVAPEAAESNAKASASSFEAAAVWREASEVFLQQLWLFPEEGPACEPDDVSLLAPDFELDGSSGSGPEGSGGGGGLLLALFVKATQRVTIVRLWSWEVVATLSSCLSAVPLLPGDDIRARTSCPSGLAGFPSRWYAADHCRTVLREANAPEPPTTEGLPQPLADLLLDPLELTRTAAVLCYDRHRLAQYLLVLSTDKQTLCLYWGSALLCRIRAADGLTGERLQSPIIRLSDPVANRFTLYCEGGQAFRCSVPLQPHSPRLAAALTALALALPAELAHPLAGDAQVWCVRRGTGRASSVDGDDEEWRRFCELLFCLVEQALAPNDGEGHSPPFKRARTAGSARDDEDMECESEADDWEWLLGSSMHARERLNARHAGLTSSLEFLPHPPLRKVAADAARGPLQAAAAASAVEPEGSGAASPRECADVWEGPTATPPEVLLKHLDTLFLVLHLLYEEWKIHTLHAWLLPPLSLLLYGLARRLQCPQFAAFYAQDFPAVRDAGIAMATFGGYGAWLWQAFPHESGVSQVGGTQSAHNVAAPVRRLQEAVVPHLLSSCREIQGLAQKAGTPIPGAYPEVFPLSSLLLNILKILCGAKLDNIAAANMPHLRRPQSIASVPSAPALDPPSPLPPFAACQKIALADADRARAIRRWIEGFISSGTQDRWEVALMLLVQHRIKSADVDLWTLALAAPVRECLRAAAEAPKSDWLMEAYSLISRDDLALLASGPEPVGERGKGNGTRRANALLDGADEPAGFDDLLNSSASANPLEASEWLYRMFDRDRRVKEVVRLLNSSRPVTLRISRRPEQTDHDYEQHKQSRLGLAANRQAALCVGRGAFTLGAVRPLPTELLNTPMLALAGRFPPQAAVVSLDPNHHSAELNIWAEFSNGVATALQVGDAPGVEITRGWILHHKSEASTNGQTSAHSHAGFLCGLGLRGHLRALPVADCYKYLRSQHDTTSVAVILGMAASHVGSMEAGLTRMCCVHIPSMLPATYSDMEVASPVQCAAVLSLGLLFARSAHRMMTELLVAEIGRRPSDRALHDREGYSLAAGFALGCVCLGLGADAPGLADLQLHTWLLRYIHGGPEMPMPGAATRDSKQNPNHDPATCSSVIAEGDGINISITSAAGCVALALMFLRTNCEAVASRIVIPQNIFQLDFIRPDFALLRLVARCLIMWDSIEASEEWVQSQLPTFLSQLQSEPEAPSAMYGAVPMEPAVAAGRQTQQKTSVGFTVLQSEAPYPRVDLGVSSSDAFSGLGSSSASGGKRLPSVFDGKSGDRGPQSGADLLGPDSEIDWLLVGQTRVSLIAGACLAIGLRFAGTSNPAAKSILISKLKAFRDAKRSTAHPALMASKPTRGMDLDRSTLETCQSVTAVALGMVMAGTGDLDSLRILRSLRKRADLETGYGVHMATHKAIGFVFLGGGKYTFDQDNLSIAALLMAAFPRYPVSLTDNRCHLQAFRHLYVLAARHRCVEAVEVDTKQPVDVMVSLETGRGEETAMLPRLMLTSSDVRSIALQSERYWPVAIRRPVPGENAAVGRWMRGLEASRRLYVKRRSGHLPHRLDALGAQGAGQVWFPTFSKPSRQHLERLLQIPKADAAGSAGPASSASSVELTWLRRAGAASGSGPLESATLTVSSAEWAAALCCEAPPLLPPDTYEFDFEDGGDGSLSERFAALLQDKAATGVVSPWLPHDRLAHWLHECIVDSKLVAYPLYLLMYLQSHNAAEDSLNPSPLSCGPSALVFSAISVDQLLTVEQFYRTVRRHIGASHGPLLSEDFLVERCAAMREAFVDNGPLTQEVLAALHRHYAGESQDGASDSFSDSALAAVYTRLHGLPGHIANVRSLTGSGAAASAVFHALPRLRRQLPTASAQGLQALFAALRGAGA